MTSTDKSKLSAAQVFCHANPCWLGINEVRTSLAGFWHIERHICVPANLALSRFVCGIGVCACCWQALQHGAGLNETGCDRIGGARVLMAGVALWSLGTLVAPPCAHAGLLALCASRVIVRAAQHLLRRPCAELGLVLCCCSSCSWPRVARLLGHTAVSRPAQLLGA